MRYALHVRCADPHCGWSGSMPMDAIARCPNCAAMVEGIPARPRRASPEPVSAADKLRELIATRPTGASLDDLLRWWNSAPLVTEALDELAALRAAAPGETIPAATLDDVVAGLGDISDQIREWSNRR